jgi:hypothetical protein
MLRAHHCSGVMKTWWDEAEREAQRDHPLSRHGGPDGIREAYLKFMQRAPVGYGTHAGSPQYSVSRSA